MSQEITAFDIFNFTQKLMFHLYPEVGEESFKNDRTLDTLEDIINGDICVTNTPQEMTRNLMGIEENTKVAEMCNKFFQRNVGGSLRKKRQ